MIVTGSSSINIALGTYFPYDDKENKHSGLEFKPSNTFVDGIVPSIYISCSKQYNSQHVFANYNPAYPICNDMISLIFNKQIKY